MLAAVLSFVGPSLGKHLQTREPCEKEFATASLDADFQTYISHCGFRCSELRLTQCENLFYLLFVSLLTVGLGAAPPVTVGERRKEQYPDLSHYTCVI